MKPGYKTLSFWGTVASFVVAIVMALIGYVPDAPDPGNTAKAVALIAAILAAAGYAVDRGRVKRGDPHKPVWKQTEFYLSVAAMTVALLIQSDVFTVDSSVGKGLAAAAGLLAMLGYGAGQKRQTPPPDLIESDIIEGPLR